MYLNHIVRPLSISFASSSRGPSRTDNKASLRATLSSDLVKLGQYAGNSITPFGRFVGTIAIALGLGGDPNKLG